MGTHFQVNAGIQKAQITTMVNPVLTFPDWIPAFAGMTGFGLSESDKNSGNGYIHCLTENWFHF